MKKTLLFTAIASCLALAPLAHAQFGGLGAAAPSIPGGGGGGATPADIDAFLSAATIADTLVVEASKSLFNAVASKESREKVEALTKAANAITDPKERQAKLDQASKEQNAEFAKVDFKKSGEALAKSADAKQKDATKNAIWNLALGALKDVELVASGRKFVSGPPSPAIAGKIPAVKETIERLSSQAEALPKVVEGAKGLMKAVGLEALPTKASEAPKTGSI